MSWCRALFITPAWAIKRPLAAVLLPTVAHERRSKIGQGQSPLERSHGRCIEGVDCRFVAKAISAHIMRLWL